MRENKEPADWRMREINACKHERTLPERVNWKKLLDAGFSPAQALYAVEREYREKLKKERDHADVQI